MSTNFKNGDIVCVTKDTHYDHMVFKRGQKFIVIGEELDKIDCYLYGTSDVYSFSPECLSKHTLYNSVIRGIYDHPKVILFVVLVLLSATVMIYK